MGRALHIIVDAFYTQHYKCKNKNISNVCKKNYTYEDVTIHLQEHYDSLGFCFYIYSYDGFLPKSPVNICKINTLYMDFFINYDLFAIAIKIFIHVIIILDLLYVF